MLLLTVPGERVMRPNYGCPLRTYIWENIDSLLTAGPEVIKNSLLAFEPRIIPTNVSAVADYNTGIVTFKIRFNIKATNSDFSLIFPFKSGLALSQP